MSKYIVYCLNTNNNQLDIISIEEDEKVAKNIQNSHSFNLLCDLNKNKSLYKIEIKQSIIQIIEININIKSGWISNTITENKQSVYDIGIITYFKKDNLSIDINDSYIPGNNKVESCQPFIKVPSGILNSIPKINIPIIVNKTPDNVRTKKNNECKPNLTVLLLEELKKKCRVKD